VTIIGSTDAVSATVETELKVVGVTTVNRYGGTDRYDTANSVVYYYAVNTRGLRPADIAVASGANFPDAAVAAASLGTRNGIVLLSEPESLSPYILDYIDAYSTAGYAPIRSVEIFGSTAALSERVRDVLVSCFGIVIAYSDIPNND
jgi:hypothetical protein